MNLSLKRHVIRKGYACCGYNIANSKKENFLSIDELMESAINDDNDVCPNCVNYIIPLLERTARGIRRISP